MSGHGMIFARFDVKWRDHPKALEAGAFGRDLWGWGVLYARDHQTDGELPRGAVLASPWGKGGRKNLAVAKELVRIGLWEETATGWRIVNYAAKNDTRAQIEERRAEERERKADYRKRASGKEKPVSLSLVPGGVPAGHEAKRPIGTPGSVSLSPSVSVSEDPADRETAAGVAASGGPPAWFLAALETLRMDSGLEAEDAGALWLDYDVSRERKGWATGQRDALSWLTKVLRGRREQRERDASRRGVPGPASARQPRGSVPWRSDTSGFGEG